jgi:hypothetical protein
MRLRGAVIGLLLVAVHAQAVRAQGDVAAMIVAARAQLDQFNPDSASALLERALAPNSGATNEQRVRAYVLYGIAQLSAKNASAARQAFRQALQLNPGERVDSLEFLEPENLLREFNAERLALAPGPAAAPAPAVVAPVPFTVQVALPADTTLAPAEGRLPILLAPSRAAKVTVTLASASTPSAPLWADTLQAGAAGALGWDLRNRDGALVPPGRYRISATAVDSAGHAAPAVTRVIVISRAPADTQALPPPLARSALLPEFTSVSHRSASGLLLGAGLGAAAALLPSALGRPELNKGLASDGTAYLVAGSVAIAGVIAFVAGGQERHPLPENVRHNETLRQQDAANRAAIVEANARARENAPVRVRLEGGRP